MIRFQVIKQKVFGKMARRWMLMAGLIIGYLIICFFFSSPKVTHGQQGTPIEDGKIDAKMQSIIIDSVALALDSNYVYPDKAREMGKYVREKFKKGEYKDLTSAMQFTGKLTEDLLEVCKDKHLRIEYLLELPLGLKDTDSMSQQELEQFVQQEAYDNFGFYKVERLDGNVGYVDFRRFSHARWAGATAVAAMNFLGNCDAIIFDLRQNGGGEPSMIQLLTSYLFEEPQHLNSFYIRPKNTTNQFWTQAYVPGKKLSNVPVFVLTSNYTFSGAEEFTYNLKNMKRATIVGETTGGGAHPVMEVYFSSLKVEMQLPMGRAINPITGTNWEGTGITPDIAVPQEKALQTAYLEAIKKIIEQTKDENKKQKLTWTVETMNALQNPAKVDAALMQKYAGKYGPRTITLENGELYYQREGRPKYKMIPLSQDTFIFDELRYFRLKFVSDSTGRVTEVVGMYNDGRTDSSARTSD
ncbi:MAG: S41 family peptidase [Candidatus Zixiibacteriota bacterium]